MNPRLCIQRMRSEELGLGEPTRTVKVFSEEKNRVAVVEVIHLSEAKRGSVGVKKITVESEESTPVTPTDDRSMRIEFIGDSITCAYGVEGNVGETSFKTTTENFMKSYAYLTAKKLNADYSTVCYSGYGVVSGWSADGSRQDKMLVPPLYDLVYEKSGKPWDHMSYDYIVINLGTNDYSYTGSDKERMEEFSNGYEAFLTQVHKAHPNSKIICLYGSMGGHELYPYIEKAVKNKTEVKSFLLDEIDIAKAGTNGHPNTADQQEIANRLVEIIQNGRV